LKLLIVEVNDLVRRLIRFLLPFANCEHFFNLVQISCEGAWGEVGEDLDARAWGAFSLMV